MFAWSNQAGVLFILPCLHRAHVCHKQCSNGVGATAERRKVYFAGSCRYHPSDETEASIKSASHAHLRQCTQPFQNHIHMWSSRRCRWERSYNNLFVTNVNLLPGAEGATGPGWQLVVSTGIVSQTRASDQTQRRRMGSASLPWHRIMRPTKRPHFTSVLRALRKQWPGVHREPNHHFYIEKTIII